MRSLIQRQDRPRTISLYSHVAVLALACMLAVACRSRDEVANGEAAVVDSAGILVVSVPPAALPPAEAVQEVTPHLVIGEDNAAAEPLYRVRGAALTRNGGLVVANGGTNELLFFGSEGELTRRVGGSGEGPGEFRRLDGFRLLDGDSILLWDEQLRRVTLYSPTGDFVEMISLADLMTQIEEPGSVGLPVGRLGDGSLLVPIRVPHRLGAGEGVGRDSVTIMRMNPEGEVQPLIPDLPGRSSFRQMLSPTQRILVTWFPPYRPLLSVSERTDSVYIYAGAGAEWRVYDATGRLARITRGGAASRTLSPDMISRMVDDSAAARGELWRTAMAEVEFPSELPAFTRIDVDRDGRVWAAWPVAPGDSIRHWTIFEGTKVEVVKGPAHGTILDRSQRSVVVLERDDQDVETVRVYRVW